MAYTEMSVKVDHIRRIAKDIGGVVTYTIEKPVVKYDSSKVFQNIGGVVTYTVAKPVEDYSSSKDITELNQNVLLSLEQ